MVPTSVSSVSLVLLISLPFDNGLGFFLCGLSVCFVNFYWVPIMCRTAETEVNGVYAWKWAGTFCQPVGVWGGGRAGVHLLIIRSQAGFEFCCCCHYLSASQISIHLVVRCLAWRLGVREFFCVPAPRSPFQPSQHACPSPQRRLPSLAIWC